MFAIVKSTEVRKRRVIMQILQTRDMGEQIQPLELEETLKEDDILEVDG